MPAIEDDVTITVLGGFEVAVGGRTVDEKGWPTRRALELVQLLALADRHQLLREQVLEALWPHLDPQAGAANLRKAAHHARQALDHVDAVVLRGGAVALFPGRTVTTDLERFEQLAARALATEDRESCAAASEVGRGELLPGSLYEEWTQQPRARTRALQLRVASVARDWAMVVELDPVHEAAYQELMRGALDAGARSAALRWYDQLRSALAHDLGVAPDDTSEQLRARCLDGLVTPAADLFGRGTELAAARSALRDAGAGRISALVVRGEAGIGKSALCREIGAVAEASGFAVWTIAAGETGQAYEPVASLVERLVIERGSELLDDLPGNARSVLAALTTAASPAAPLDGPLSRHQLVGALHAVLRAAAERMRVLLVLDDAHRADDATVEALGQMASSVGDVFVLFAHRSGPMPPTLGRTVDRLSRAGSIRSIDVGRLEADDAAALARAAAGRPLSDALVERIVRRGEGNPFATEELARAASIGAGRAGKTEALPATVTDAIVGRLVDLDDEAISGLSRAALVAGDLDGRSALALMGDTEPAALVALDRALAAGVLVVDGMRYRFRHELVREALAARLPPHQTLAVHRDVATRLAEVGAAAALVGRHWLAGGRPDEAGEWLLVAAREALQLGGFADARRHVAPVLAHVATHAEALQVDALALDMMGDPAALLAYDRAIAAADDVNAHDLVAMRALAQVKLGDPAGALVSIEGATPTSVMGRLSEALTYAGAAALGFAEPALGTAKAAESRRLALESGDTSAIVIASWAQAAAAHARGELHDSVLADLRDTSTVPHLAVRVFDGHLCMTQRFLYGARPYAEVIAFADAIADEGARLGAARGHAFGVTLRGEAELLSGALDAAEADLLEGGRLHRSIGGTTGEAHSLQRLAEVAIHRGQMDRARALVAEALDVARVTDIGFHLLDRVYGTRIAVAGRADEALDVVDEAEDAVRGPLETCPGCRITFAVPAAIACARAGEVERALEYEKSAEWLAHVVMRLPAWDAAYDEVRGHVALALGEHDRARERFAVAADGFGTAGQPLDRSRCLALAADV